MQYNGAKIVFSRNYTGTPGHPRGTQLTSFPKFNLKWIINLNVKCKCKMSSYKTPRK